MFGSMLEVLMYHQYSRRMKTQRVVAWVKGRAYCL